MSHTGISQNTGKQTCKKAIVLNAPGVCAIKSKKKTKNLNQLLLPIPATQQYNQKLIPPLISTQELIDYFVHLPFSFFAHPCIKKDEIVESN